MKPGQDRIVSHTDAEWNTLDPVLADGEIGINRNGGRMKYGDGVTRWSSLVYLDQNFATNAEVAQVTADIAQVSAQIAEVSKKTEQVDALVEKVADNSARIEDVKTKLDAITSSRAQPIPAPDPVPFPDGPVP